MRGRRLEERVERFRHRRAMRLERTRERVVIGEIHRLGDGSLVLRGARQGLRLLVVVVLQAMLEAAQELVGARERRGAPRVDEAARGHRGERGARGRRAQRRVAPAAHQLEELHAELDLADAARADLDVVAPAAPARRLEDPPVQLAQRLEQSEVEVAPIDEGRHTLLEARVGPRDDARFEPGVTLPGACVSDEVLLERGERGRERAAVAEGTQPHVHAEGLSVGGRLREERDEGASGGGEEFAMRMRPAARLALGAVEEHEVDVGGDVQLRAAELAERSDRERGAIRGLAVARDGAAVGLDERRAHAFLGERAHGREDFVERGEVVQVAMRERHHHPLAQPP